MYYICPRCNKSFYNKDYDICPECGYNIKKYKKSDYVTKLIYALTHKRGDIQHLVIDIIISKKLKKAIPYLKSLEKTTKDPLLKTKLKDAIKKLNNPF